jgi:hypothetical protein
MTFIISCLLFSYAVPFLADFPGAQQTAMGGACVALADDAYANLYNPAGLAIQTRPGLAGEYFHVPWETNRYYANAAALVPVRAGTAAGLYFVSGKEDWEFTGNTAHNSGFAAGGTFGHAFGDEFAAGIGLKYLSLSLYHKYDYYSESTDVKDHTFAADLGVLIRHDIGFGEWRLGATVQTLGPAFSQRALVGELPTTARIGLCYVVTVPEMMTPDAEGWLRRYFRFGKGKFGEYLLDHWRLVIAYDMNIGFARKADGSDYDDTLLDLKPQHSLGAEVRPLPFFAFRLGYYDDMRIDPWSYSNGRGWTMGMGLDLKYLRVDIADDHVFYRPGMSDQPFRLRVSVSSDL